MHAQKMIFFLSMDMDSARVLCSEMIARCGIIWEGRESYAKLSGHTDSLAEFEQWVCGFFGSGVVLGASLESIALARLQNRNLTLAIAESCTGGLLSYHFTRISGASSVFLGSVVSYANAIKEQILGVKADILEDFGAVSEPTLAQMLCGTLERFQSHIAIASSGVAGPSGGSEAKPVGSVFLGVQARGKAPLIERHFFATECYNLSQNHSILESKTESSVSDVTNNANNESSAGGASSANNASGARQQMLSCAITARESIQLQASQKAIEMLIKYIG